MLRDSNHNPTIHNKKIVVTGGAGFIGSNLTHALAKVDLNNKVIVIDNLSTGRIENIQGLINNKKIEFIKNSITDLALLQKIFRGVNYVFHLAAVASVPKSVEDPVPTHNTNVTGTLNVLLAARDNDVGKVIFSSSCAVYGNPSEHQLPLKETAPPHPLSPYAASKLMGEYYCNVFSEVYDLPTVCLRYFNVYGPRQDPNGEYAAVIPKFISRIKQDKPLIIYGDGSQTRDFIYVKDVVNSNIALATSSDAQGIFNVGTGEKTSISFLANTLLSIHGKDLEFIKYKPKRIGDIQESFTDTTKLEHVLQRNGYEVLLDLKNGLIDTAEIDEDEILIL